MKNKDEIKHEIFDLAQKISRASSEKTLTEITREMHELVVLLKYAKDLDVIPAPKEEEKVVIANAEPTKVEPQPVVVEKQQVTIDLFSTETAVAEPVAAAPTPAPTPVAEKPVPVKEKKEPKKKASESVAEKLQHNKITDLKASIGINEKFQFINELFEGNMKEYTVAVDQINSFSSHSDAESYIANLEEVYKWQEENQIAGNFKELVQRRFA